MKHLPVLLLLSCATPHLKVSFLDSLKQDPKSAHVCIVQSPTEMECITLSRFIRMAKETREEESPFRGDL